MITCSPRCPGVLRAGPGAMLIGRLFSVLIQLAAAVRSSARAQDVPKGEAAFAEYVAAQLRREFKGAQVEVNGPLTLVIGGGVEFNLGRIFTDCCDNAERNLNVR